MTPFNHILRRFRHDETGAIMAEAVLVLPFMLWSYLALFVYWDNYRAINTVQKAAYTVSDMISREMLPVTEAYVVGMDAMMEYLIDPDQNAKTRVTSISWSQLNNRYEVLWSRSPHNALPVLTTGGLVALEYKLPQLADGDTLVLFETEVGYKPSFKVGLNNQTIKQFIATRPRFVPKICLTTVACT